MRMNARWHRRYVCIEVLSSSNTGDEIEGKKALYFEKGAKEVWLCNRSGDIEYFDQGGRLAMSAFFPHFPQKLVPCQIHIDGFGEK